MNRVAEVRKQGRTSWQIGIDQPENLVIGLFVRDVAGLKTSHSWLPHCAPAIARDNRQGSAAAAHQWDLWWDRSISTLRNRTDQSPDPFAGPHWLPPDFESLEASPALQEIVARHFDDARQWATARRQDHIEFMMGTSDPRPFHRARRGGRGFVETRLVARLEQDLGRPAQPFQLRITVIPVAGKELWQLDLQNVLLTDELLTDATEYRTRITPLLQALL